MLSILLVDDDIQIRQLLSDYLAGFGMTIGTVFGRIAGQEAARRARN